MSLIDNEKTISQFVQTQFPSLYTEEGPAFIDFLTAYYEWMEQEKGVMTRVRDLASYADIDTTLDEFLDHFHSAYLYGIPETLKTDKRFLVKHILDVYRSKGTIRGYKLLFRLLFNEDINVYLPSRDILRASDGTWQETRYIEVTDMPYNDKVVGKKISGLTTSATAIVESYVRQPVNGKMVSTLFLTALDGEFDEGEKIVLEDERDIVFQLSEDLPKIVGSMTSLDVVSGGQNFTVGDSLQVIDGQGVEGQARVAEVTSGTGTLRFIVEDGGSRFSTNAHVYVTRDTSLGFPVGQGASADVGSIIGQEQVTYNTNLIVDHRDRTVGNNTNIINSGSVIGDTLAFQTRTFGTIAGFTNILSGNNYQRPPTIAVRDILVSNTLEGTVSYGTTSANVVGTGTTFARYLAANDLIELVSTDGKIDYRIVKTVSNNTHLILDDFPSVTQAAGSYRLTPELHRANFSVQSGKLMAANSSVYGENEHVVGSPLSGSGIISKLQVKNSGLAYEAGETVSLALIGPISEVTINNGGTKYANNETVVFSGGGAITGARGYVETDGTGKIINVVITYVGSGYKTAPDVRVLTVRGTGADLTAVIGEFDTPYVVRATVGTSGTAKSRGQWTTTRGFLNSDKYLQDSYYYQEYSYEIQSTMALSQYADIVKKIFHLSGTEMFGRVFLEDKQEAISSVVSDEIVSQPL